MQSYNGKLLFRIDCTPVERAGQNFALSADGMRLAVVRETTVHHEATKDYDQYTEREAAVEVYAMPPLTEQDKAAVKQAEALAPQDTGARIDLSLERVSTPTARDAASGADAESGTIAASSAITAGASSAAGADSSAQSAAAVKEQGAAKPAGAVVLGDPVPESGRKRPTLYGPDEKHAGGQEEMPAGNSSK